MTPREALEKACYEARRFRYIPDYEGDDPVVAAFTDEWDTVAEFEGRQGGDCDGFAMWTIDRAWHLAPGTYAFVAGDVLVRGTWGGHAWVELVTDTGERLWADPTWGWGPMTPSALGYTSDAPTRRPIVRWVFDGSAFPVEEAYQEPHV